MSIGITWQITPIVEGSGYSTEPSLAFSPSGQPSIAYSAGFAQALRLATLAGTALWTFETADKRIFRRKHALSALPLQPARCQLYFPLRFLGPSGSRPTAFRAAHWW